MNTKYGKISDKTYKDYKVKLINNIYKILPMKEEKTDTINVYIESVLYELVGMEKVLYEAGEICSIISVLENLITEQDLKIVKREVFRAISLVKRM